jgi:hypothetical protein
LVAEREVHFQHGLVLLEIFRPTEHPWLRQTFIPKLCLKSGKDFRMNDTFLREKFDNYTLRNMLGTACSAILIAPDG